MPRWGNLNIKSYFTPAAVNHTKQQDKDNNETRKVEAATWPVEHVLLKGEGLQSSGDAKREDEGEDLHSKAAGAVTSGPQLALF